MYKRFLFAGESRCETNVKHSLSHTSNQLKCLEMRLSLFLSAASACLAQTLKEGSLQPLTFVAVGIAHPRRDSKTGVTHNAKQDLSCPASP